MNNLFFTSQTGKRLYDKYAEKLPIIDYHCHLQPSEIAENKRFEDLGQMWLSQDHYKWRAMRTFGIPERLITGDASYYEKFLAFAEIFPKLVGNPIYIWCRLELKRYFNIDEPLCDANAKTIYDNTKSQIETRNLCPRSFIEMSNVEYIATTDDPVDDLRYHAVLHDDQSFRTRVVPTFRPDKAMNTDSPEFAAYIKRLSEITDTEIGTFDSLINSLEIRLKYFKQHGSNITDNGLDNFHWADSTPDERDAIMQKSLHGDVLTAQEKRKYQTAFLIETAKLYKRYGFVMQLHISAYRNANSRMKSLLGVDTGFDCTDGETPIRDLGKLLDSLHSMDSLPKTILYPLNIEQYEIFAILAAAFCTEEIKSRVILGAPWWFNDQPYGIQKQLESVSQLYPLSLFIGMLTDSRSFLSYPRHEVFRRILCNYLGGLVDKGEYASGDRELRDIIEAVCYKNAKEYFCIS